MENSKETTKFLETNLEYDLDNLPENIVIEVDKDITLVISFTLFVNSNDKTLDKTSDTDIVQVS